MFTLKPFQEGAVTRLVTKLKTQLSALATGAEINPNIVFKSPTGSGKTLMTAEVLRRLPEDFSLAGQNLVFLWLAPRELHAQSFRKLSGILADSAYHLVNIDNGLSAGSVRANTILFSNWEKLNTTAGKTNEEKGVQKGDWTNIAVRDGETGANLQDILRQTRDAGAKIIVIVDESHQTFYGEKSQRFMEEVVKPALVIEVSATPKLPPTIEVPHGDVVESGLIKKEVILNNELARDADTDRTVIENLLKLSLAKREELKARYNALAPGINPLLLIQLPNEGATLSELDKRDREIIEELLAKRGISYGDGNLAVWLSGEHVNLENITANDGAVEVLIFKQAIALGWDCPRAQVLMMLREIKSESFKIQTIGRILRMPEARHYGDDLLDAAFVYTDLASIEVDADEKDPLKNLLKYKRSRIREGFENVVLPESVFLSRVDYGDLRASFSPFLKKALNAAFAFDAGDFEPARYEKLRRRLKLDDTELAMPVISDEVLRNLDEVDRREFDRERLTKLRLDESTVENMFNLLLRGFIQPFTNFARSRNIVYPALRDVLATAGVDDARLQRAVVCSRENQGVFREIFRKALDAYDATHRAEMQTRRDREMEIRDFSIPETDEFSDNTTEVRTAKNVHKPYYRKNDAPAGTEIRFEAWLDAHEKITWWYKNGERMRKYFAIPYFEIGDDGKTHRAAFYPDYIVRFTDGSIGIFDTKSGITTENKHAAAKANALQGWLRKCSSDKRCLWGGIVKPAGHGWEIQADARLRGNAAMPAGKGAVAETAEDSGYDASRWKSLMF